VDLAKRIPASQRLVRVTRNRLGLERPRDSSQPQRTRGAIPRVNPYEITELVGGRVPVLCCFERPHTGTWCHRALVAAWLCGALGEPVPEFGFEGLPQGEHPLRPPADSSTALTPRQGRLALD
jgi:hypothetical protein